MNWRFAELADAAHTPVVPTGLRRRYDSQSRQGAPGHGPPNRSVALVSWRVDDGLRTGRPLPGVDPRLFGNVIHWFDVPNHLGAAVPAELADEIRQ